jgi:hypothetical protein
MLSSHQDALEIADPVPTLSSCGGSMTACERRRSHGKQQRGQNRRAHLPDLVHGVGQLADEELIDLIRVAIGEARRRGIGSVSQVGESSQRTAPVEKRTTPTVGRITRKIPPMAEIPPAKAN